MRRFFVIVLIIVCCIPSLFAQSWNDIVADKTTYLTGEGYGDTYEEADEMALSDLISKISVAVSSDITIMDDELQTNQKIDSKSYIKSKISTLSEATLTNTEKIILSHEPDAHVGRYIRRSEITRIFDGRKRKIMQYVRLAQVAEQGLKLDDALRNYYWAYSLLKTIQHANEVEYVDERKESHLLVSWIPQMINNILGSIKVKVEKVEDRNVLLRFSYNDKPVSSLDYVYYDGKGWTNINSCNNGIGVLELPSGIEINNIQLKYVYDYRSQAHLDYEVQSVMKVIKGKPLRKSMISLNLNNVEPSGTSAGHQNQPKESRPTTSAESAKSQQTNGTSVVANPLLYQEATDKIVSLVKARKYSEISQYCTQYGSDIVNRLLAYGKATVLPYTTLKMTKYDDMVIVHSVPMSFSFANGSRQSFVENVVFTFTEDGKLDNLSFGLDDITADNIMSHTVWPEQARLTIINFLENYKTAFALERIDYISDIFADDAIIIVGKIVRRIERSDIPINNQYIKRTQYTKQQYLAHLKNVFDQNEFVNIRFGSCVVKKAGANRGELYGIQIKQDYYSSHYGDSGYLYLQVEFKDSKTPMIRVRTWQDQPDPELNRVYGMEDF